jgi:hypothetical protein
LSLEIRDEPRELARHAGACVCKPRQHTLACERPERRAGGPADVPRAREQLGQQALEALDPRAEREPPFSQLAPVARLVGLGGHDKQRVLPVRHVRPHSLQDEMRLARVGGSRYERD